MATYPHPHSAPSHVVRTLVVGFIAGAVAVLVFHQGALAMLHSLGFSPRAPYSVQLTAPWGVPQVWSLTFWGGVWGVILAAIFGRLDGPPLVWWSVLFGAIVPTLVVWFVLAPLKGQPVMAGGDLHAMATGLIVNAAWGLGTGLGLLIFGHPHYVPERTIRE
jgi:hypothetical protein